MGEYFLSNTAVCCKNVWQHLRYIFTAPKIEPNWIFFQHSFYDMNPCLSVIQVSVDRFMQSQSYHNKTSSDWIMTFQPVPHFGYWSPWTWTNEKPVSRPRDNSRPIRGRVQVWHCQCAEIQFGYLARSVVNWPLPPAPRAQGWVSAVFYLILYLLMVLDHDGWGYYCKVYQLTLCCGCHSDKLFSHLWFQSNQWHVIEPIKVVLGSPGADVPQVVASFLSSSR